MLHDRSTETSSDQVQPRGLVLTPCHLGRTSTNCQSNRSASCVCMRSDKGDWSLTGEHRTTLQHVSSVLIVLGLSLEDLPNELNDKRHPDLRRSIIRNLSDLVVHFLSRFRSDTQKNKPKSTRRHCGIALKFLGFGRSGNRLLDRT
jgi:hypothetical protein